MCLSACLGAVSYSRDTFAIIGNASEMHVWHVAFNFSVDHSILHLSLHIVQRDWLLLIDLNYV